MSLTGLIFAVVVLSIMIPLMVIAVVWPAPLARWNGAAQRTLPIAAPRRVRERAALASSPRLMRAWGTGGLTMGTLIVISITRSLLLNGIDPAPANLSPLLTGGFIVIGTAQAIFGVVLVVRSRRILDMLRRRFAEDGAGLRRWMVIAWGCVGILMSCAVFLIVLLGI